MQQETILVVSQDFTIGRKLLWSSLTPCENMWVWFLKALKAFTPALGFSRLFLRLKNLF